MRRGPLSQKDKDYLIKNKDKDIKTLSKKLKRTETSIVSFLESLKTEVKQESKPTVETPVSASLVRNKTFGAVIMTETSSMISDEVRKKNLANKPAVSSRYKNAIHIMRKENDL